MSDAAHIFSNLEVWHPRVLVVDDDEVCRLAATTLLERLGLAVDVASDGREALEMAAE